MDFSSIYEIISGSKPLPYETYEKLLEASDAGIEGLEEVAKSLIGFPVVGNIIAWLAGSTLRWAAKEIISLIPHEPSPEEVEEMSEKRTDEEAKTRAHDDAVKLAKIMSKELHERRGGDAAMKQAENFKPFNQMLNSHLGMVEETAGGFLSTPQIAPIIPYNPQRRAKIPISVINPRRWNNTAQTARIGVRTPFIGVNAVGF